MISTPCLRHGSNGSPAAAAEVSQTKRSPDAWPKTPGQKSEVLKIRPRRLILVGKSWKNQWTFILCSNTSNEKRSRKNVQSKVTLLMESHGRHLQHRWQNYSDNSVSDLNDRAGAVSKVHLGLQLPHDRARPAARVQSGWNTFRVQCETHVLAPRHGLMTSNNHHLT